MSLLLRRRALLAKLKKFLRKIVGIPPVSCPACAEESAVDYKICGNSIQDGTPTPDTPVEVQSVGEKTKNLFNIGTINDYIYYSSSNIKIEDNSLSLQHVASSVNYCYKKDTHYPSGSYAYSYDTVSGAEIQVLIRCYDNNGNTLTNSDVSIQGGEYVDYYKGWIKTWNLNKIVVPDNVAYWIIGFRTQGTADVWNTITNIQVELGDTATPYEPYGKYKIPVVSSGKNLFDIDTYVKNSNTYNGRYIDISQYGVGTKLTISTTDKHIFKIADTAGGTSLLQNGNGNTNTFSFTLLQKYKDCGRLYIISNKTYTAATKEDLSNQNAQLEYGDTATDFEPYQEPITTNIYLTEPLRKAGTVADCVDFANSKVVRNIKKVELAEANYTYAWNNTNGVSFANILDGNYFINKNAISNRINQFDQETPKPTSLWVGVNNAYIYWIKILDYLGFTTVEEFNTWLAENPTYVYYATKTPVEESIEFPQLPTLKGTTVYTIGTTIQPSNMEVTYYSKESE